MSTQDGSKRLVGPRHGAIRAAGRRFAALALPGLAVIAQACASDVPPPAPAKPAPPKTAADPALQRSIGELIAQCEKRAGAAGQVVDTRFERLVGTTLVESWIVARGDEQIVYTVQLTPGEKGVEVAIPDCPPKPPVK